MSTNGTNGGKRHNRGGRTKHPSWGERWGYGRGDPPFSAVIDGAGNTVAYRDRRGRDYSTREFRAMLFPGAV